MKKYGIFDKWRIDELKYTDIKSTTDPLWTETEKIMMESFPEHELRAGETRRKIVENTDFCPVAISTDEDGVIGALYYWNIDGLTYIEHLAVRSDMRGRNVGTEMLAGFIAGRRILLEIEPPDSELRIRRLNFYRRLGFAETGISFMHPTFRRDCEPYLLSVLTFPEAIDMKGFGAFERFFNDVICKYSEKEQTKLLLVTSAR